MDTRYLESLLSVLDSGSIAAAARAGNLTAAALSLRVQALEKQLGCTLLDRSAHSVKPTPACTRLAPQMRAIVRQASALREDVEVDGLAGDFRLGAISTALTGLLPGVLEGLGNHAPRLRLRITPGDSRLLFDQLMADELDAAILVQPPFPVAKHIRCAVLRSEPLMFLSRHVTQPHEVPEQLRTQPYLRYDACSWGGQIAQRYLDDLGIEPRVSCDLDALETISILVGCGQGVALVPQWGGLQAGACQALPVDPGERFARQVVLAYSAPGRKPAVIPLLKRLAGPGARP